MTIVSDLTKQLIINSDSFEANGDLSAFLDCVVIFSTQSSGKAQIAVPGGQGADWAGVLRTDTVTDGLVGEIVTEGTVKIKASGAFNAGIALAISGVDGRVAAAGSGDYVVGYSREASNAANHKISVELKKFQLN